MKALTVLLGLFLAFVSVPALAGPAGGSAQVGVSSSQGASGSSSGSGYDWPEVVVGGNAISFIAPFQIGMVGYLPKARFAVQYDRQLRKAHWVFLGVGLLADYGGYKNFRLDKCGLEDGGGMNPVGSCGKGGVLGFDIYGGYAYKWYLRKRPYIVPILRAAVGFSWWALPELGGGDSNRLQSRTKSWTLNLRPGGGVRFFLLKTLALGIDVNLPIGFAINSEIPPGGPKDKEGSFLLGIELLPVVVEYRF